jgi:hypothetical protein
MRFRNVFITLGSVLTIILWLLTDPDSGIVQNMSIGAGTLATLVILTKSILYVAVLHLTRKALLDYLDLESLFKKAKETPEGSGYAIIGVSLIMISVAITIYAATSN